MSKLLDKLIKAGSIKETAILSESTIFNMSDMIPTPVPALNMALSGSVKGGISPGILMIAGPSKHFKSLMALIMVASYMDKHKDGVCIFYDNEFGSPKEYFQMLGIDINRVIHKPLKNIEVLKHDVSQTLDQIERGDKVIVLVDSIGNIASKKEEDDALDGKSVADMSRAKQLKSFFRIVTPHMKMKDFPMVVINHTYKEQSLFPRDIVSGGTGAYYSANDIWIMGRQQEKAQVSGKKELLGYNFTINIEKSRFVKEKSKINIRVLNGQGIDYFSNVREVAEFAGLIGKPVQGKYSLIDQETGEFVGEAVREKNIKELLAKVIDLPEFDEASKKMYKLANGGSLISFDVEEDDEEE